MRKLGEDERKLAIARQVMVRYNAALSVLAKGDASPYMTDEFREQIEVAKKHLAPYTTVEDAKHKRQ